MLIRALIVLLLVLNLGVAAWWLSRPAASPVTADLQPDGVPRLQLLTEAADAPLATRPTPVDAPAAAQEAEADAGAAAAAAAAAPEAPPTPLAAASEPAPAAQCFSLGPFESEAGTRAARSALGVDATRATSRSLPGRSASGYNVILPPAADRAAAQAVAARIGAAGFDDYLVVNSGEMTNAVALGRYGTRPTAERRAAALQAAGFAAEVRPIGSEGPAQWWLDVRAPADLSRQQAQTQSLAPQSRSIDCATLR